MAVVEDNGEQPGFSPSARGPAAKSDRPFTVALDLRILQTEDARRGIGHYTRGLCEAFAAWGSPRADLEHRKGTVASRSPFQFLPVWSSEAPRPHLHLPDQVEPLVLPSPEHRETRFGRRVLNRLGFAAAESLAPAVRMNRLLLEAGADILHVHSPLHGPFPWTVTPELPIVATVYDLIPLQHRSQMLDAWPAMARNRYLRRLKRLDRCHALVAISQSVADDLRERCTQPLIRIARPGLRSELARMQRTPPTEHVQRRHVLAFASSNPSKNTSRFLEAWGLMNLQEDHAAPLVLVATDEPAAAHARTEAARRGYEDRLDVRLRPGDEELAHLYSRAILFVLPSLAEGFGLPALEAMAFGAPVAASDTPVLREVVADCGAYFDPLSTADMRRVLGEFLNDADRRRRCADAALRRATLFTWADAAAEVLHTYTRVLGALNGEVQTGA